MRIRNIYHEAVRRCDLIQHHVKSEGWCVNGLDSPGDCKFGVENFTTINVKTFYIHSDYTIFEVIFNQFR